MKQQWKILGRHKWVSGATITESADINNENGLRRYTATIRGWKNFKIWTGNTAYTDMKQRTDEIIAIVKSIRERIDAGDRSVFEEKGAW